MTLQFIIQVYFQFRRKFLKWIQLLRFNNIILASGLEILYGWKLYQLWCLHLSAVFLHSVMQFRGLGNLTATSFSFGKSSANTDGRLRQSFQSVETSCTSCTVNSTTQCTRAQINHKLLSRGLFRSFHSEHFRKGSDKSCDLTKRRCSRKLSSHAWKSNVSWWLPIHSG